MWMRFCATIRSPASSRRALTAPVKLRRVASGLIIDKVRSVAIAALLGFRLGRLSKGLRPGGQGGTSFPPKASAPAATVSLFDHTGHENAQGRGGPPNSPQEQRS